MSDDYQNRFKENVLYQMQIANLNRLILDMRIASNWDVYWDSILTLYDFLIYDVQKHCKRVPDLIRAAREEMRSMQKGIDFDDPLQVIFAKEKFISVKKKYGIEIHKIIMKGLDKENLLLKRYQVEHGQTGDLSQFSR